VRMLLQAIGGLSIIAGLLAAHALALYLIWWLVMIVVTWVPLVGRRHRRRNWDRLNRRR
jgi:hypothetical protein